MQKSSSHDPRYSATGSVYATTIRGLFREVCLRPHGALSDHCVDTRKHNPTAPNAGQYILSGELMKKFEYKTLVLPFRVGIFKQGVPDIKAALDAEGGDGWQFKQMILPSSQWGTSDSMVAILERTVE